MFLVIFCSNFSRPLTFPFTEIFLPYMHLSLVTFSLPTRIRHSRMASSLGFLLIIHLKFMTDIKRFTYRKRCEGGYLSFKICHVFFIANVEIHVCCKSRIKYKILLKLF